MHAHTAAAVFYRVAVLDAQGREVEGLPRKKNLILDAGLDLVAVERWQDCIRYAVAGSGNTPTRRDSGAVTVSRAGNTLTASAGYFVAADVGRLFKFNTGQEVRISAFTNGTTATTTTAGAIAAAPGTMWDVKQTGLDAELARTQTYGTGAGDNTVTLDAVAGTLTQRRTFIFPPEAGARTYREVGWSPSGDAGANLFGRDVLPAGGVTLGAGQQLKIVLELVLSLELLTPSAANFMSWNPAATAAQEQLENIGWDGAFNPSAAANVSVFVSESADAFRSPRAVLGFSPGEWLAGTYHAVNSTSPAYVPGSFERTVSGFFTLNDGNSAALRCAGFGWIDYGSLYPVLRVRFASIQTKDSDRGLRLDFKHTWGRVLVN